MISISELLENHKLNFLTENIGKQNLFGIDHLESTGSEIATAVSRWQRDAQRRGINLRGNLQFEKGSKHLNVFYTSLETGERKLLGGLIQAKASSGHPMVIRQMEFHLIGETYPQRLTRLRKERQFSTPQPVETIDDMREKLKALENIPLNSGQERIARIQDSIERLKARIASREG